MSEEVIAFENLLNMFHYVGVEKPTSHEGTPFNMNQCQEAETTQMTSGTQFNQRKNQNTYFLSSKSKPNKSSGIVLTARRNKANIIVTS